MTESRPFLPLNAKKSLNLVTYSYAFVTGLLLVVAVIFQVPSISTVGRELSQVDWDSFLPARLPGWSVQDRPIAESPELLRETQKVLRYDAAILRTYSRGTEQLSIYIAFWSPDTVSAESVAEHTPDICWIANGWTMTVLPAMPAVSSVSGIVPLNNYRRFKQGATELDVLYWHVNGRSYFDGNLTVSRKAPLPEVLLQRLRNIKVTMIGGSQSQLFVRISSNRPLSDPLALPPLVGVLRLLAETAPQHEKLD
jgi:hypothetical protein